MVLYYLDASVWIKRYCEEAGSDRVARFFAAGPAMGCASLGLIEVLCTLARKVKASELDADDAKLKSAEAERDFGLFHRVFLTAELHDRACRYARDYALRGADTVHLVSCMELRHVMRARFEDVVMVSSDAELIAGAGACGLPVLNPDHEDLPGPETDEESFAHD
jgi:predicted nucleic acid-binding protein